MKKLLKSEVCGIREQCIDALFTIEKSKYAAGKKKREGNANVDPRLPIQKDTKLLKPKNFTFEKILVGKLSFCF